MTTDPPSTRLFAAGSAESDSPPAPTGAIVRAAREGDAGAWDEIHRRYRSSMLVVILAKLPHIRADARLDPEDVLQEAFRRAVEGLPEFRYRGRGTLASWLMRIAANACAEWTRHNGRQRRSPLSERPEASFAGGDPNEPVRGLDGLRSEHAGPSTTAENRERERRTLQRIATLLDDVERRIVCARYLEGASRAEVASELGLSIAKVRKRESEALERLGHDLD